MQMALSPEDAAELEEVQSWVEMMADFEESEGDHLIALAMRSALLVVVSYPPRCATSNAASPG